MSTQIHFVTGKGGTGKSHFSTALAIKLAEGNQKPVLLIDYRSAGDIFRYFNQELEMMKIVKSSQHSKVNLLSLSPMGCLREFLSRFLAFNKNSKGSFLKNKVVDVIFSNKLISAFVSACPGLEPVVTMGKIKWEYESGNWSHIVIDGLATGHSYLELSSIVQLQKVFQKGFVFGEIIKIKEFLWDPQVTQYYCLATPHELPLKESKEFTAKLKSIGLENSQIIYNQIDSFSWESESLENKNETLKKEIKYFLEKQKLEKKLIAEQDSQRDEQSLKIPFIVADNPLERINIVKESVLL